METKDLAPLPVDAENNHIPTADEIKHDEAVAAEAVAEAQADAAAAPAAAEPVAVIDDTPAAAPLEPLPVAEPLADVPAAPLADPVGDLIAEDEKGAVLVADDSAKIGDSPAPFGLEPGAVVVSNSGNTEMTVEAISEGKAKCIWHDKADGQAKTDHFDINALTVIKSADQAAKENAVVVPPSEHHDGVVQELGAETVVKADSDPVAPA